MKAGRSKRPEKKLVHLPRNRNRGTRPEYSEHRRAKRGKKVQRDDAAALLRDLGEVTSRLIQASNDFHRIARDYSGLDGSNWRRNRHIRTTIVRAIAKELYQTNPYNVDKIICLEVILERVLERSLEKERK